MTTGSGNRYRDQGQLLISQSQISNSAGYGVIVEDALRNLPSYDWFDPAKEEFHSQYSIGDYTPQPGPVRNLRELNPEHLTTGVSIVSNVIALNGEGGISYGGDPNGFVIVAPVADEEGDAGEVWDEFMFDIIDHNGLTRRFEFHDLQQNANPVAGTDYQAGNIPVFFDRAPDCPYGMDRCEPRYSPINEDVADHLLEAIESSNLDVTVFRGKGDELFVEGATLVYSLEPDILPMPGWFEQFIHPAQIGAVPYGRIVNNTIVGLGGSLTDQKQIVIRPTDPTQEPIVKIINDFKDVGIRIDDNAAPTLLNNIIVNFEVGVGADNTPTGTVLGGMMFQGNRRNISNINVGDFAITLGPTAPLFVDFANGNYYPADSSRAIDSAIDSLEDRPELVTVKNPLGIARSPLLAPDRDVLGQLREDDPTVEPPEGLGRNVFKDRGAIDRVDFVGPTVQLRTPRDNDATGVDLDPALTSVALAPSVILRQFEIEFLDTSQLGDARDGTGVDAITVNADSVTVTQDGELLTVDVDYRLDFDVTNSVLRLTPTAGVWPAGNTYLITLDESLIRDIAGNPLQANQPTGGVTFTVTTLLGTDYGDAPAPYPTLSADNGASHEIKDGFFLGTGVTAEEDGQPSPASQLGCGGRRRCLPVHHRARQNGLDHRHCLGQRTPGRLDRFQSGR